MEELTMAMMEISVVPIGTDSPALSEHITRAVRAAKESGLKYELNPMGTVIEGDLDDLFRVARLMHEATFSDKVRRVVTTIKIDDRRDRHMTAEQKIKAVMEKL